MRVGTHNVNGLGTTARATAAARLWQQLGLDLILVQETHLTGSTCGGVDAVLSDHGYRAVWGHHLSNSAGVGMVARLRLLDSGELRLDEACAQHLVPGRLLVIPARWAGHKLQLASIYLPSGEWTQQRALIANELGALATRGGGEPLWGGDFNFVPDQSRDRLCTRGSTPPRRQEERDTAQAWQQALPQLHDVFRERHPWRRAYTYVSPRSASRLDRFYAQTTLMEHVGGCQVARHILGARPGSGSTSCTPYAVSDHRPVQLELIGRLPPTIGPGLRRLRVEFLASPRHAQGVQEWVQAEAGRAPLGHASLLAWWPGFKQALVAKCKAAQRRFRADSEPGAATAARQQLEDMYDKLDAGEEVPIAAVYQAQQAWAAAAALAAHARRLRACHAWVHSGERPSPALSRILAPPRAARLVSALKDSNGRLVADQPALAGLVARTWAAVSARPRTDPTATAAVLSALDASPCLPASEADALGCTVVTVAQVHRALKATPPGRSPGIDGIPSQLYRRLGAPLHALLARLYTAIGTLQCTPPGFLDGAISIMHKHGDRTEAANYRPITLLNTDYRLLAKVLANRLQPLLPTVIDRSQLAFIRGRSIGEAVLLMQTLPAWLQLQGRGAVAVLCDFAKAFDTVDRSFLLAVLRKLGMGDGFITWVTTILRNTRACAVVNGFRSGFEPFLAGVRQGCPLAPLLYLFVGQAMLQWWRVSGVGVQGPPAHPTLVGIQFADDANAFLPQLDDIPRFLSCMEVFAAACNQHLQRSKVKALLLGAAVHRAPGAPTAPGTAHGLSVVTQATVLGVPVGGGDEAAAAARWESALDKVWKAFGRIAKAGLSAFGRGFASAVHGTAIILYLAEYSDMLPQRHLDILARNTAKLVDRGRAPADTSRGFPGLKSNLLPGSPATGGFGAMPWSEHITARHVAWGARFAMAFFTKDHSQAWAVVLISLMRGSIPSPHCHPLWLFTHPKAAVAPGRPQERPLPPPLNRLLSAARALPPLCDVGPGALTPGPWCQFAPLWGNPLLTHSGTGLEHHFPSLALVPELATLGDLLRLLDAAAQPTGLPHVRQLRSASRAGAELRELHSLVPLAWREAARVLPPLPLAPQGSSSDPFWTVVLPRLGWRLPTMLPMFLGALSVKGVTALLCSGPSGPQASRAPRLAAFATLAGAPGNATLVRLALCRLWRSPLAGGVKETFWRLVHDGLPTAARLHQDPMSPRACCPCGAVGADRAHHYWDCIAARGVREEITTAAAAALQPISHLSCTNIWLSQCPPGLHQGAWDIVAMVAVASMDKARRFMVAQRDFTQPPALAGADLGRRGAEHARRSFWELLHEFQANGGVPRTTIATPLSATHPFLCSPAPGICQVQAASPGSTATLSPLP